MGAYLMEDLSEIIKRKEYFDDIIDSKTISDQINCQKRIMSKFRSYLGCENEIKLEELNHISFLIEHLFKLPEKYMKSDCSRMWIVFWILHSLELMSVRLETENTEKIINFIRACQNKNGGFAGGPGQRSHLGTTYAAVASLCIVGATDPRAFDVLDKDSLKTFILSCKSDDGSFRVAPDNETDMRAIYCAASVARITNIYTSEMFLNTDAYLLSCQNYDGGFGSLPGCESVGGYSFCAYASLVLLNKEDIVDNYKLLNWTIHRQMLSEGGFQGRVNKLVDSCYSYWCGALIPLIQAHCDIYTDYTPRYILNREANQYFLLLVAQTFEGGFKDRLGQAPDLYHTCYSLSSLSLSQHSFFDDHIFSCV
ncbi:hypothetical protein HZS_4839, partial [Henneguya salminicola]